MKSFPSPWVQHVLFFIPYFFTACTCVTLLLVNLDDGTSTLRQAGVVNTVLFGLYLTGWLGPHYLKLGCGFFNCAVSAYLLWRSHVHSAAVLLSVYCIPAFVFVVQAVFVPSISEIVPGRICISNRSAAFSPTLLEGFHVTHILDLTTSSRQARSPRYTVQRVQVHDFLGSQGSLDAALQECMDFMHMALAQEDAIVLIHCSAGQSRSAAFFLYYLMTMETDEPRTKRMNLRDAYAFLRAKRPVVDISSDHMAPLQARDAAMQQTQKTR